MKAGSDTEHAALLTLAREALTAHLSGARPPAFAAISAAAQPAAAFVTLRNDGELRGCIGCIEVREPLGEVVVRCAVAAASNDPRVAPVTLAELPDIRVEVSVLGPLERVERLEDFAIGRHGLLIESGWSRGLLLPQVATEWGWDRETFVRQTCLKAGLPADAWHAGAALFKFEADVFGEE
jgi:AmmeMemoRadiSam system protein A